MKGTLIHAYGKGELAALYFPHLQVASARRNLRRWIAHNAKLKAELEAAGYTDKAVLLTPKEVRIIFEYLGEP